VWDVLSKAWLNTHLVTWPLLVNQKWLLVRLSNQRPWFGKYLVMWSMLANQGRPQRHTVTLSRVSHCHIHTRFVQSEALIWQIPSHVISVSQSETVTGESVTHHHNVTCVTLSHAQLPCIYHMHTVTMSHCHMHTVTLSHAHCHIVTLLMSRDGPMTFQLRAGCQLLTYYYWVSLWPNSGERKQWRSMTARGFVFGSIATEITSFDRAFQDLSLDTQLKS